ncbi:hypothetical protein PAPYR_4537 [Paratrimastix pyriformis]|uniref:Uncharacterized protein n=1 Tax=Paratrimastix pyriformis TaxID=342808 RepID=A0ABQ8UM02_9EUKA|nr:hypothetical protein PAPYR_4537 [Paratrimastix pyriformis]
MPLEVVLLDLGLDSSQNLEALAFALDHMRGCLTQYIHHLSFCQLSPLRIAAFLAPSSLAATSTPIEIGPFHLNHLCETLAKVSPPSVADCTFDLYPILERLTSYLGRVSTQPKRLLVITTRLGALRPSLAAVLQRAFDAGLHIDVLAVRLPLPEMAVTIPVQDWAQELTTFPNLAIESLDCNLIFLAQFFQRRYSALYAPSTPIIIRLGQAQHTDDDTRTGGLSIRCVLRSDVTGPLNLEPIVYCRCHMQPVFGSPPLVDALPPIRGLLPSNGTPIEGAGGGPSKCSVTGDSLEPRRVGLGVRAGRSLFPCPPLPPSARLTANKQTLNSPRGTLELTPIERLAIERVSLHLLRGHPYLLLPATDDLDTITENEEVFSALTRTLSERDQALVLRYTYTPGPRLPPMHKFFVAIPPTPPPRAAPVSPGHPDEPDQKGSSLPDPNEALLLLKELPSAEEILLEHTVPGASGMARDLDPETQRRVTQGLDQIPLGVDFNPLRCTSGLHEVLQALVEVGGSRDEAQPDRKLPPSPRKRGLGSSLGDGGGIRRGLTFENNDRGGR